MKKTIRLTESDLMKIVKRVIKEQDDDVQTWDDFEKKYPIYHGDVDSLDKRMNALYNNPGLRARILADYDKNSKIKSLKNQLKELDREKNRIMRELNDLGYNA